MRRIVFLLLLSVGLVATYSVAHAQADDTFNFVSSDAATWIDRISGVDADNLFTVYMEQIFGTSEQRTLLAQVAGIANVVGLVLAVVILLYVMIGGVVRTAHEGAVLGKNWSSVWLPIRISVGIGLLMPTGEGGLSTAQHMILGLVDVGNRLATIAWNGTVDGLLSGAQISGVVDTGDMDFTETKLQLLVCAESWYQVQQDQGRDARWGFYVARTGDNNRVRRDIQGGIRENGGLQLPADGTITSIAFGDQGRCGSINLHDYAGVVTDGSSEQGAIGQSEQSRNLFNSVAFSPVILRARGNAAVAGGIVVVERLEGLAQIAGAIVTAQDDEYAGRPGLGGGEGVLADNVEYNGASPRVRQIAADIRDFDRNTSNAIIARAMEVIQSDTSYVDGYRDSLKQGGWPMAGAWFLQLDRFQNLASSSVEGVKSSAKYVGNIGNCQGQRSWFSRNSSAGCEAIVKDVSAVSKLVEQAKIERMGSSPTHTDVMAVLGCEGDCTARGIWSNLSGSIARALLDALTGLGTIKNPAVTEFGLSSSMTSDTGITNPFQVVTSLGHGIQTVTTTVTLANIGIAAGAFGASGNVAASFFGAGGLEGAYRAIAPLITGMIVLMFGAGFTLAFVIPFMPATIWIVMLVKYLITVIEGFVAAPLAVAQMVTPEGEGISGTRMERAWALMAAMVARPPLMVVGLVAAMTISYVGFAIMNSIWWTVVDLNTTTGIWEVLAILILYPAMAVMILKKCIEVMATLPDTILTWFSSGVGGAFGGDNGAAGLDQEGTMKTAAGSIHKGAAERAAGKVSSDQKRAESQAQQAAAKRQDQAREEREDRRFDRLADNLANRLGGGRR
ncbi:conjugal transfer/type IV secretion protein DotA/TraY [Natronocella acetinitrilica]|uniref:Conjugal transfer/type IV secretion protein DotA/TraY n=1 Tax=Natronocella acetinitrilica TaxID=414046 RepID=A0AAE3G2K0_9GAMM|nr:DotA/TraY family protein [Natronocella acetinitrilica]MCP1674252.1 conjugal transfer/type IV secretion protein DotA/TraY [Natronocella acetinitrilica]